MAAELLGLPLDPLSYRRMALAMMKDIPDVREYAQWWADLAADAERAGCFFLAEECKKRAVYYETQESGRYLRVWSGHSFAELVRVS
jgi:hypothetical protein